MAGRRPLLTRCARPARPASHTDSLRRVATTPDPERLAPAAVLTLHRTPRACSGRFPGSSRGQSDFLAAAPRCPPLQSRQLQRDASARSRQPPQVPAAFRSGYARIPARLWHPQHPWEGVPTWNDALSRHVARDRANCHMCRLYKAYPTCTFEDTVKIPFFLTFLKQIERLCT